MLFSHLRVHGCLVELIVERSEEEAPSWPACFRISLSGHLGLNMSTILFESIFKVKAVNKDGTYFDRGTS